MEHRTETKVRAEGTIVLEKLPFSEGETVDVIVVSHHDTVSGKREYSLRGKPILYDNLFRQSRKTIGMHRHDFIDGHVNLMGADDPPRVG